MKSCSKGHPSIREEDRGSRQAPELEPHASSSKEKIKQFSRVEGFWAYDPVLDGEGWPILTVV